MHDNHKTCRAALLALAATAVFAEGWGRAGAAQELSPPGDPGGIAVFRGGVAPSAVAVRREGELSIDGNLDDPAWQVAPVITGFVQGVPLEGATPSEPTEVRVVFDDRAIYVAARMYETDPQSIRARLTRRDERGSFDSFKLALDPNRDGLTGYEFEVSAAGAETDKYLFGDTQEDANWDAIWDSAVGIDERGWTVEMRIPLSQIRYEAKAGIQSWGVNFERRRLETNETDYFALQSRTARGRVSQFGTIDGIQVARSQRRLEVRPFAVSQYLAAPPEPGDPFFSGREVTPRGGVDMSMGIGSAFSLDATINPDFGQVEVDPEVINLSAFETFFPEKRPFFVRDAQIFSFAGSRGGRRGGGKALFFSRRIGRSPRGSGPGDADYRDAPRQTAILGAAKLTGRTGGGLSVGALTALTGRESGRAYFSENDSTVQFVAEPPGGHVVLRLQQDFRGGASKVGVIGTGLRRNLPQDGAFDYLPSDAYSFGVDFEHQWGGQRNRDYRLWGFFSSSLVQGSTTALLRLQRSSNHYFHRPDASYLAVDSTATSMFGSDWRLQLEKDGEHWTWSTWLGQQTPGFEVNELGFITSGERLDLGARASYRNIRPGNLFRSYNISLFTYHNLRHSLLDDFFDGANWARSYDAGAAWLSGRFTLLNNWGVNMTLSYSPEGQSDTQTRGGPLMTDPAEFNVRFEANSDRSRAFHASPEVSYRSAGLGRGHEFRTGLDLSFRPVPNWRLSVNPNYSRTLDGAQYVTTSSALDFAPTYGSRYIFGRLERTTLSMDTRLNVALTPDVSLQLYAQPLLSSGDYLGYRQLAAAESFDFLDFSEGGAAAGADGSVAGCSDGTTCVSGETRYFDFDGDGTADHSSRDRDFNIRSLRGNVVFRWEYRPGSELFLVWQHSRRGSLNIGNFDFGRDFGGLFDTPAENVLILKVSHYISL